MNVFGRASHCALSQDEARRKYTCSMSHHQYSKVAYLNVVVTAVLQPCSRAKRSKRSSDNNKIT
jgi:hypothetical protein